MSETINDPNTGESAPGTGPATDPVTTPAPATSPAPVSTPDTTEHDNKVKGLEATAKAERNKRQVAEQELERLRNEQSATDIDPLDPESIRNAAKSEAQKLINDERAADEAKRQSDAWGEKLQTAQEKHKDVNLNDVINDQTLPISQAMGDVIRTSADGIDVLLHLNQNRDLAAKIAGMDQTSAALEMGRISAQLEASGGVRVSNAPEPITPVGQRSVSEKDPDDMTPSEYEEHMRQKRGGSVFS